MQLMHLTDVSPSHTRTGSLLMLMKRRCTYTRSVCRPMTHFFWGSAFSEQRVSLLAIDFLRLFNVLSTQVFCYLSKQLPLGQGNVCSSAEPFIIVFLQRQLETTICRLTFCLSECKIWGAVIIERVRGQESTWNRWLAHHMSGLLKSMFGVIFLSGKNSAIKLSKALLLQKSDSCGLFLLIHVI